MFKHYRKTAITAMTDWHPGFDMTGVSISEADRATGSPQLGDKIAWNPDKPGDRWLIAGEYHAANYVEVPQPPAGAFIIDNTSDDSAFSVAAAIDYINSVDLTPDPVTVPDSPPDFGGGDSGGGGASSDW